MKRTIVERYLISLAAICPNFDGRMFSLFSYALMCHVVMREEGQREKRKVLVLSGNMKYFQSSILVITLSLSINLRLSAQSLSIT